MINECFSQTMIVLTSSVELENRMAKEWICKDARSSSVSREKAHALE